MGYLHIDNLYKNSEILLFRECYALEKIHGSSAWVRWKPSESWSSKEGKLHYHAGGVKAARLQELFNEDALTKAIHEYLDPRDSIVVYGEVYGGKHQRMRHIYGDDLRFTAFDVKIGGHWLNVPNAHDVATKLGLEFVHYEKGPAEAEWLNAQRDAPSVQAQRCGMGDDKEREGIVVRPLMELTKNNGKRIICKHRIHKFSETATPREISPEKLKVLNEAKAIAEEWVVPMRLEHVLQKLLPKGETWSMSDAGQVISAMIKDVLREAEGEIVWSKAAQKAVSSRTAYLLKKHIAIGVE